MKANVSLTQAQRRAMRQEIRRQLAEYNAHNGLETCSLVLYVLHEEFGFGEKRLKRFYDAFKPAIDEMTERYCMHDPGDDVWLATRKLREAGIDIEVWAAAEKSEEE